MSDQPSVVGMFREYAALERLRSGAGVTPLEYQRWLDLRTRLESKLTQQHGERREFDRKPTRLRVDFRSEQSLHRAVIRNLSRGGVFVATPFAAEVGTTLILLLQIQDTGESVEVPGVVVTNNVADGFSTARMGMGVRFEGLSEQQQEWVDSLLVDSAAGADERAVVAAEPAAAEPE